MAKGANLAEYKWGNRREKIIQLVLQVERWSKDHRGQFRCSMVEPNYKDLAIGDRDCDGLICVSVAFLWQEFVRLNA